jgi:hypothetical protein
MDGYKVTRAFERHNGKTLRTYKRGDTISLKDAAKIPSLNRLVASGHIYREVSPIITEEVE